MYNTLFIFLVSEITISGGNLINGIIGVIMIIGIILTNRWTVKKAYKKDLKKKVDIILFNKHEELNTLQFGSLKDEIKQNNETVKESFENVNNKLDILIEKNIPNK